MLKDSVLASAEDAIDGCLHDLIDAVKAFAKVCGNARHMPAKTKGNFLV
jgi:hypothetical protein